jgi:hypothetical protein
MSGHFVEPLKLTEIQILNPALKRKYLKTIISDKDLRYEFYFL